MENQNTTILGLDEIEVHNTAIDDLDSESVNLIFIGIDQSASMSSFTPDMIAALDEFKNALSNSKEADEMLVARANFYNTHVHVGGYKKIDQFDTDFHTDGMTPLYDVVVEGTEKLTEYMGFLKAQGVRVKAVFAIFSDGLDNASIANISKARNKIEELNAQEITTAFISFGPEAKPEADRLRFQNVLHVGSSASELRKAFNVLSKSVIEASKSVVATKNDFFTM